MYRPVMRIGTALGCLILAGATARPVEAQFVQSYYQVAPVPVVTSYYTPVVSYYAPRVSYYAPVTSYYAAPVTSYYAAPVTSYYAAPAGVVTTRSYYGYGVFRPRGVYTQSYYTPVAPVTSYYYAPVLWR